MRLRQPKSILCVRHGESELNLQHTTMRDTEAYKKFLALYKADPTHPIAIDQARALADEYCSAASDAEADLSEYGKIQSLLTGHGLKMEARKDRLPVPDIIFISPYKRAVATFENIKLFWPELEKVRVVEDLRLREQEVGVVHNYGDYFTFLTLNPEQQKLFDTQGLYWYRFPGGESVPDVRLRVNSWLHDMRHEFSGKNILVVSHFNTLLSLRAELNNWSAEEWLRVERETRKINCAVTQYEQNKWSVEDYGKLQAVRYNEKLW